MKSLLLICLLIPTLSLAIPEGKLATEWINKARPFFESMTTGSLTNAQGLKLKYYFHKNPLNSKSLVIVPGRTEPALKYAEVIYDLKGAGFNFFILDHQGQGESQRILVDSHKGHVVVFNNYVKDFELFMNKVVKPNNPNPLYLIAHSMGAAVATYYTSAHPKAFEKIVLTAPMLELDTRPYSELIARIYSKFLVLSRQGNKYAPDYGPYISENDTFEKNTVTHSEARHNISKFIFISRPSLALGGPTAKWVNEALKATRYIDRLPHETPVLLFQAGQDVIVKPARQNSFCRNGMCELIQFPDAKHEILMEKDSIRDQAMNEIKLFFGI